jgi:hypothetical protein
MVNRMSRRIKINQEEIIKLAETHKDSNKFVNELKKSFKIILSERGNFFLKVGKILHKSSYHNLALNVLFTLYIFLRKIMIKEEN